MIRSAVLAVMCPLARSAKHLPKHAINPSHRRVTTLLPPHCRCLSLSGTHHRNPQHHLDTPTTSTPSKDSSPSDSAAVSESSDSLDVKEYLSKLSDTEKEEFARTELAKLSEADQKRLRVLEMEYDVWMSTGVKVPEDMSDALWLQLLHTPSRFARGKLYTYWYKRQWKERNDVTKKKERTERHLVRQEENRRKLEQMAREQGLPEGEIPFKNTFMMFLRAQTMLKHYYNNLCWAMQYGQPLVMDLSLEQHMKDRERTSLIKQLLNVHGVNKIRTEPFNLVMTGLHPDGFINSKLKPLLGEEESLPMTVTSQDYLDLYPAERLVYLTPNSPNELLTWDPNDVYVIGALVDLADEKPITFAKARRQKIRTARLPLDRFLMWQMGGKAMTLDVLMKVLCDMKDTGDWPTALRHIPTRKAQIRPQYQAGGSGKTHPDGKPQYQARKGQSDYRPHKQSNQRQQYNRKPSWKR